MGETEIEIVIWSPDPQPPTHLLAPTKKRPSLQERPLENLGQTSSLKITKEVALANASLLCLAFFQSSKLHSARQCNLSQRGHILECQSHCKRTGQLLEGVYRGGLKGPAAGLSSILFVFCIGFLHEILFKERILWLKGSENDWSSEPLPLAPPVVLRVRKLRCGKVKRPWLLYFHPVCQCWSSSLLMANTVIFQLH